MSKRKLGESNESERKRQKICLNNENIFQIEDTFTKKCSEDFSKNPENILARNSVTNVGSLFSCTDYEEARKVSHIFLNSLKKKNLKATNQGASGRCWMFSGLNIFRHNLIKVLELENFEFSETYLFFWDKFERSNFFLQWISKFDSYECMNDNSEFFNFLIEGEKWMSDGGYWSCFSNLVEKYGVVPKNAMPETYQSDCSSDMNEIIMDILHGCASNIFKTKKQGKQVIIKKMIDDTLQQIYNTLVKFLGQPPEKFTWDFMKETQEPVVMEGLDPISFKDMVLPGIKMKDFIVLTNIPSKKYPYYKKYEVKNTSNVIGADNFTFINLPINELKKYTKKSVISGLPVWFAGDIGKGFHPIHSTLNDKILNTDLVFGKKMGMTKEERILFSNQKTSHAMTIVGVNIDHKEKTTTWQVENSWGFIDSEEPGLDGFLCMTDKWFDEYLGEVVIYKEFLSRKIKNIIKEDPILIEPWESIAPALRVNSNYKQQRELQSIFKNKF